MDFVPENVAGDISGNCKTLILPALSIGNVGQLAVDLLVSSTGASRVGYLDDPCVIPCVGNDAYGPVADGILSLPLEVYASPSHALSLIQQRSPVVKGLMVDFAKNMADFIFSAGKEHVVILSSLDSGRRKKIDDPSAAQVYYISSSSDNGTDSKCEKLGWKKLEEFNPSQSRWKYLSYLAEGNARQEDMLGSEDEPTGDDYFAGLPFAALFSCCKAKGLKVWCLFCYCSEGDNIPDSFKLAEAACKLQGLRPENFCGSENSGWVIPLSWKTVYGPPPDINLF